MPYIRYMAYSGKYTEELLKPIVEAQMSFAGVIKSLGLKPTGGNYRMIQGHIRRLQLDTAHFTGQGWSKGKNKYNSKAIHKGSIKTRYPDNEVFVQRSSYPSSRLKQRLVDKGWDYRCSICQSTRWLGEPLILHIDHINGDHIDHRLENLRFLCPNCHQQTKTWGNKRDKKASMVELLDTPDLGSGVRKGRAGWTPAAGTKTCTNCNKLIGRKATRCKRCAGLQQKTKIIWPPLDKLTERIKNSSYIAVARELGVSDNAIRKHIRKRGSYNKVRLPPFAPKDT